MSIQAVERAKYDRIWLVDDYRTYAPGEGWIGMFLEMAAHQTGATLLDAGCGTGRVGEALAAKGYDVTLMDLSDTALEVRGLPFVQGSLWDETAYPCRFDTCYCSDVLEHIPTEFTMLTIVRLLEHCDTVFLTICTEPDSFGVRIGEPLHLTVKPFVWWRDRLRELAEVVEARDCGVTSVFYLRSRAYGAAQN